MTPTKAALNFGRLLAFLAECHHRENGRFGYISFDGQASGFSITLQLKNMLRRGDNSERSEPRLADRYSGHRPT
jgi:hypothetical protein